MAWDWIIVAVLFSGMGLAAIQYYRSQAKKYRSGGRNEAMDKHRDGSCH